MSYELAASDQSEFLQRLEGGLDKAGDEGEKRGVPAYVTFVWQKTQNDELKSRIREAGGEIPTFVQVRAGFEQPVKPLRFHLFHLKTIATLNDQNGKIIDAEPTMPRGLSREEMKGWGEHSFAVIGVVNGDIITPATISLRTGSRKALLNAGVAVKDAGGPVWAGRGPKFKATLDYTRYPAGRVIAVGSVRPDKSETTGNAMLVGTCSVAAVTREEAERFNLHMEDEQFVLDLQATVAMHARRLKSLLSKQMEEATDE